MFSDGDINLKPLDEDYPVIPWYKSCVASNPVMATRVTVKGATGLEKQQTIGSELDPVHRVTHMVPEEFLLTVQNHSYVSV